MMYLGCWSTLLALQFVPVFGQIFQYFFVNNNEAKVIDTVKLPTCTFLDVKKGVILRGGLNSGRFTKVGPMKDIHACIDACCQEPSCDVAFMPASVCYSIDCFSEEKCQSIPAVIDSHLNGTVEIAHIVRGGPGDDPLEFRKYAGLNKPGSAKHVCKLTTVLQGYTLKGGRAAGEWIELGQAGDLPDPAVCARRCCEFPTCQAAVVEDKKCFAVDCFTKDSCQVVLSLPANTSSSVTYIVSRNGTHQKNKASCEHACDHGLCVADNFCACAEGYSGDFCDKHSENDNVRKSVTAGVVEQGTRVLFTDADPEAEMAVRIPESPGVRQSESFSTIAVALVCGLVASVVGVSSILFLGRRVLGQVTPTEYISSHTSLIHH